MKKRFLALALTLTALGSFLPAAAADGMAQSLKLPSLHEIYKDHFLFGNIYSGSTNYAASNISDRRFDLLKRHFNALTAENAMKPVNMSPSNGSYSFATADKMLQTVSDAGISVHGHALVWHSQSAAWLTAGRTRAEAKANLEAYINQVAGHYKGKLISWDVVNEAFLVSVNSVPADWKSALRTGAGGNEASPWYAAYENGADKSKGESGADYIYDAFVFARLADPGATLYYNDYNEEYQGKREAIAMMTEAINAQWAKDPRNTEPGRLLIEGLGMQAHYWTDAFYISNIEATIKRFAETGAIISVSELDIPAGRWDGYKTLTPELEKTQARQYAQLFQLYKKYSHLIERVSIWGLEDTASWRRQGSPLLFDGDFNAKEAYYAVADPDGYLAGRYDDRATRDALLQEAVKKNDPPSLSNFTKVQTYDNNFTDIAAHYAKDWIIKAYDYGIIAGSGTTYGTTNNMTVQDALVIASKMHGIYNNGAYDYNSHGAYPNGYISYALNNGLTDDRFDGEYTRPATRGELAYIWGNILPKSELQKLNDYAPFSDVPATHKYYEEIKLFYEAGIVTGSGGSFSPDSNVIRGDCAVMFVRLVSVTDRSGYKG